MGSDFVVPIQWTMYNSDIHFIQEKVSSEIVSTVYWRFEGQFVDCFTKSHTREMFQCSWLAWPDQYLCTSLTEVDNIRANWRNVALCII